MQFSHYTRIMSATVAREVSWSKLLFNNAHALRVAALIDSGGAEVDSISLQQELKLGQSSVHRVLKVLEGVELLERLERTSRTEPIKYRRAEHPFWSAATQLMTASIADGATT